MAYDFGGAWDRLLDREVDEYYADHGIETHMDAFIPFKKNGTQYAVSVTDWQLGNDLAESSLFKQDAVGCWYEIDTESDEAQDCYADIAWEVVEAAWNAGNYMTEEDMEAQNDWD
jgi:hypothetical protein